MSIPARFSYAQILCFVAIVDAGSLAQAGRLLGMSTSGVSRTLSRLEEAYGVKLLHRSTHALSLTDEGERLIGLARDAVQSAAEVEAAFNEAGGEMEGGRVRISAPTAFVRTTLLPLVPAFMDRFPLITLDFRCSDQLADLADAGIDLALRAGDLAGTPGYIQQHVAHFRWVTCAAPAYLEAHGVPDTPQDLQAHRLIGFRNQRTGAVDPWRYRQALPLEPGADRWAPRTAIELDDAQSAFDVARGGGGIVWAPDWLAAQALESGEVVRILQDWETLTSPLSLIRRDRRLTPKRISIVIQWLKAALLNASSAPA